MLTSQSERLIVATPAFLTSHVYAVAVCTESSVFGSLKKLECLGRSIYLPVHAAGQLTKFYQCRTQRQGLVVTDNERGAPLLFRNSAVFFRSGRKTSHFFILFY